MQPKMWILDDGLKLLRSGFCSFYGNILMFRTEIHFSLILLLTQKPDLARLVYS